MPSAADTPRTYTGAYGLCRDPAGRLLLAHLSRGLDAGRWTLPGGGVEWGEHPDAAVRRELDEETGLTDILGAKVVAVYSQTYERSAERPYDSVHHIGIIYDMSLGNFALSCEEDGTTDRCGWFSEDQVRQLPLVPLAEFALDLAWPPS